MTKKFLLVVSLLSLTVIAACGGSSTTGSTGTTTTVEDTAPDDVVLSSPTATITGGTSISEYGLKGIGIKGVEDDFETKKAAYQQLKGGTGECTFSLIQMSSILVPCYGPSIEYQNHPDGAAPNPAAPYLPPSDTGLWNETADGSTQEACAAKKMNALVGEVSGYVDNMINTIGGMICAEKKAGIELPEINGSEDVKEEITAHINVPGLDFTTATLERLANDGTNPVYRSTAETVMTMGDQTVNGTVIVKHVPTATDNSTYKGKISYTMATAQDDVQSNCSGTTGMTIAGTILYEKSSATSMKYEMNYAMFCGQTADPLDANNNISPTDKFCSTTEINAGQCTTPNLDGWANNWNYGLFEIDPTTGMGTVAYAWQAGYYDGATRVFNITVDDAADGSASGTAYYGFGPDIAEAVAGVTKGKITQFICNWAGPGMGPNGGNRQPVEKAQRQTLTRAVGGTVFTPATSNITYAPANSCSADADHTDFKYWSINSAQDPTPINPAMSNDKTTVGTRDVGLIGLTTEYVFTLPTPPTDL